MIDRQHDLSLSRQARVLGISRGSLYHLPRVVAIVDLALLRWICRAVGTGSGAPILSSEKQLT